MSRMTTLTEHQAIGEFAKDAAIWFEQNEQGATFSREIPAAGHLLALRWGMGEDCVLVVKLDPEFEPVNFQNLIRRK